MCGALLIPGRGFTEAGQPLQTLVQAVHGVHRPVQLLADQGMVLHCACRNLQGKEVA